MQSYTLIPLATLPHGGAPHSHTVLSARPGNTDTSFCPGSAVPNSYACYLFSYFMCGFQLISGDVKKVDIILMFSPQFKTKSLMKLWWLVAGALPFVSGDESIFPPLFPTLDISLQAAPSAECQRDSSLLLQGLKNQSLWAMRSKYQPIEP